jgi:3-deoxy-D-manno-octulosonic-acid transferase
METELWPNLLAAVRQRKEHSRCMLANGRLSERSARRYGSLPHCLAPALIRLWLRVAAQTETAMPERIAANSARLACECLRQSQVRCHPATRDSWNLGQRLARGVWARARCCYAASTREGEEALILDAWQRADLPRQRALLVLVPRHPQRFKMLPDPDSALRRSGIPAAQLANRRTSRTRRSGWATAWAKCLPISPPGRYRLRRRQPDRRSAART